MTFFFFSSRLLSNDFRAPLIKALMARGHSVWHVRIGRVNVVKRPDGGQTEFVGAIGFGRLIRSLAESSKLSVPPVILFDTTGACVPIRALLLRASLRGIWCFDIFDNFLYELRGFRRFIRRVSLSLLTAFSPINIVLSPESLRLFRRAYHLENAAHTRWLSRDLDNLPDLVMLFSIDNRLDLALVEEVAALASPAKIKLYGRFATDDPVPQRRLLRLCEKHRNVVFLGEYSFDNIDAILAPFGIGFMPYVTNNTLTTFINPDKYYLYLNSGMEVISTEIPQARRMSDRVHIARSASDVIEIRDRILSDRSFRKNNRTYQPFSWEQRSEELIGLIQSHMDGRLGEITESGN
jgi:hypothetical protein